MGFPGGLGGQFEGHICEAMHIGLATLTYFHELEVSTNDLVVGRVAVSELDDLPILPNLERAHGLVGVEVTLPRLALHHLVGAVGERAGIGLSNTVHHLNGGAYLTGLVERATHIHRIDTLVGDFKQGTVQAGTAQGSEKPGLQVALFNQDTASHHLVRHGELVDHPIVLHQNYLVGSGKQHTFVGGAFMQDVLAVGQQVIRCAGLALSIGDQGLDHLAGLIFLALHHDRVSAVVDDFKGNPRKISVPLRCAAGDAVLLLHAEAAPFHLIHGGDRHRMSIPPHSDRFPGPGRQHGFISLGLPNLVGAVGKGIVASACSTGFVGRDGYYHLAHSVSLAAHHHGVGGTVNHLKGNSRKGGIALWCTPHLAVLLGNVNTAPDYLVFGLVLQHDAIRVNGYGDFLRESLEHGVIGRDFSHGVLTIGQGAFPGGGHTRRVGGDGHGHLAGLGSVAVHHHGVLGVIDDLERNALQAGIALGSCPCLGIQLLDGQPAPLDFFC